MSTSTPTADAALAPDLQHVLQTVERHVGYLRVATSVDDDTAASPDTGVPWHACATLIDNPKRLADLIRSTKAGRGTQQDSVAASLFVQAYAFRIGALVLAPFALGLPTPSCDPVDTFVRLGRHRPAGVAVTNDAVERRSVEQVVSELLGRHFAPLIAAATSEITIGRRLLWGNVAASCATVFRAIDGAVGTAERVAVREWADGFFLAAASWLDGLGEFEQTDLEEWRWQRTNCCLYYQCEGGRKCDDCSLLRSGPETVPA
ncbi:MAG: ferric iron reductase [Ilumatobacteraceae bacterium]|nr:ferric iron reductase [Ilumatobacteraceae bacterium]